MNIILLLKNYFLLFFFQDDSIINDSDSASSSSGVSESRIKKFISDHRKCPYFEVSLETGENVNEVFQSGEFAFQFPSNSFQFHFFYYL